LFFILGQKPHGSVGRGSKKKFDVGMIREGIGRHYSMQGNIGVEQ